MALRAVIFDVGGVLTHEDPIERLVERWHRRSGIDAELLSQAVAAVDPRAAETGALSEREFTTGLARRFDLTAGQAAEWMADMWDWYCGDSNEVMRAYARSLQPAYVTAILSNSFDGARGEEARRFQFEQDFDPIMYSHEVGLAKPNPRVFEHTLLTIGCEPADAAFVDDRIENVDAAAALGVRAIHHTNSETTIAVLDRLLRT